MKKKKHSMQDTSAEASMSEHEEIKDLLIKSIKWSEAVYNQNKKIQKHLKWMSIAGYVRLLIILIPLILGLIYLPPLLGNVWEQYQSVLGISGGGSIDADSLKSLFEQFNGSETRIE